MSTMYSLLNGIPRYAETDSAEHIQNNANNQANSEQFSESQREQICISALSAIVGVAVYLQDEEVGCYIFIHVKILTLTLDITASMFNAGISSQIAFIYCKRNLDQEIG